MEGSVARYTKKGERHAKNNSGAIIGCLIGGIITIELLIIIFLLII